MNGKRMLGAIVLLLGALALLAALNRGESAEPYSAGQIGGMVFCGLMALVGLYFLIRGKRPPAPPGGRAD